ncbi:MAG: GntR family transcriptional regulator [Alphaproteobacteria bacterium]|nr:GntR family transcriptional regulator [Alphaproteobacteria bacterium]
MTSIAEGTNGAPLYRRLLASLRDKIRRGEWAVGGHLPTESELSEQYGVSRITVRHALALLEQDGFIRKARARRTEVVSAGPIKSLGYPMESLGDVVAMAANATLSVESYVRERQPEAAELLGEKAEARLPCLRSVLKREGRAYARSTIYFSMRVGARLRVKDFDDTVVFRAVARKLSIEIGDVSHSVWAEGANESDALRLACAVGAPLLATLLLYRDAVGAPFEAAYTRALAADVRLTYGFRGGRS